VFVPLTENATDAGPVADQVYVSDASPASSAPSTESVVVFAFTTVAEADAAVTTVGGLFGGRAVVTVAAPVTPAAEAETVEVAGTVGAVNSPAWDTAPPPDTDHAKVGNGETGSPNWSVAAAANCCVAPTNTLVALGLTVITDTFRATVTLTEDVVVSPSVSRIVAVSV
jgi:hypothetical protein